MRIHELELTTVTNRTHNCIIISNERIKVAIDTLLAEAITAFVTLTRIEHHIITEGAVEQ